MLQCRRVRYVCKLLPEVDVYRDMRSRRDSESLRGGWRLEVQSRGKHVAGRERQGWLSDHKCTYEPRFPEVYIQGLQSNTYIGI